VGNLLVLEGPEPAYLKVGEGKEERERDRGGRVQRPVKASNGQYWRTISGQYSGK
jgi:hypothetical protein